MVSTTSTSINAVPYAGHRILASRLESLNLLTLKERDALIRDLADILDSERRRAVFDVMTVSHLSQFFMPSPREYEDFFEFKRAADESRRLFRNLGLFEARDDGSLLDYNHFHRPLTEDGSFYSKAEDGPSVVTA